MRIRYSGTFYLRRFWTFDKAQNYSHRQKEHEGSYNDSRRERKTFEKMHISYRKRKRVVGMCLLFTIRTLPITKVPPLRPYLTVHGMKS